VLCDRFRVITNRPAKNAVKTNKSVTYKAILV
jgi:hypothetical protein